MAKAIGRAAIVTRMKAMAARLGKRRITRDEFVRESGIPRRAISRHFVRFWDLLREAGLDDQPPNRPVDDETLLRALRDGCHEVGGVIGQWRFMQTSKHHANTVKKRWGGWDKALQALRDWLLRHEPAFPHLDALDDYCARRRQLKASGEAPSDRRFGEILRFRAMEHAPTSESGVICLFGMVAGELGFVLEGLGSGFPDAEVKRRDGRGWRRARVEFEHQSRNFVAHGHDPAGCDLIVCWEHNWRDCPLEVLELKSAVRKLANGPLSARSGEREGPAALRCGPSRPATGAKDWASLEGWPCFETPSCGRRLSMRFVFWRPAPPPIKKAVSCETAFSALKRRPR